MVRNDWMAVDTQLTLDFEACFELTEIPATLGTGMQQMTQLSEVKLDFRSCKLDKLARAFTSREDFLTACGQEGACIFLFRFRI